RAGVIVTLFFSTASVATETFNSLMYTFAFASFWPCSEVTVPLITTCAWAVATPPTANIAMATNPFRNIGIKPVRLIPLSLQMGSMRHSTAAQRQTSESTEILRIRVAVETTRRNYCWAKEYHSV